MSVDTSRKVLVQLIGKAEGMPTAEDLANPIAGIDRIGGPLLAQATAAWEELGIEPTERGGGLGEWDCGAFIAAKDVPVVIVALTDRFRAAFKAHLLRWHVSVLPVDTDVYTRKSRG